MIRLRVSDSGCGMDEATLARIFEPFFTTKKAGEGTGLGLSIVQSIVQDHGGTISIQSAVGHGTTFSLLFPAHAEIGVVEPPVAPIPVVEESRGMILIVDDEVAVATVAAAVLKRAGYSVAAFTSTRDAWREFAADAGKFNLVLTDYRMPDMTGIEFVQRVHTLAPGLGAVIMTGLVDQIAVNERGQCRVLEKPFETTELLKIVREAFAKT
jgi:CheY-like chemotaxis protein